MPSISLRHLSANTRTYRRIPDDELGAAYPSVHVDRKTYFALEPGEQYAIQVALDGYSRFEVVCSLDGRDVLTNTPANYNAQRGVVTSSGVINFKGWRTSNSEVKAFIAESLGYGRTTSEKSGGAASARGTIGVAIFREHRMVTTQSILRETWNPTPHGLSNDGWGGSRGVDLESLGSEVTRSGGGQLLNMNKGGGARGMSMEGTECFAGPTRGGEERSLGATRGGGAAPAPSVGTKAGHSISDSVGQTTFVRAKDMYGVEEPPTLIEIEYDSLANLIARKIWPEPPQASKAWAGMPVQPFCDPKRL